MRCLEFMEPDNFNNRWGGIKQSPLVIFAITGPLHWSKMMYEGNGGYSGMRIGRGYRNARKTPLLVLRCPSQMQQELF
jgi:hypothetical protein